jgi:hypothetical protein
MFFFQPKIGGASEKFKTQPRPLLRPRSVNFRQHFRNLSRKTVPLKSIKIFPSRDAIPLMFLLYTGHHKNYHGGIEAKNL